MSAEWCEPDNCPAAICGGPHFVADGPYGRVIAPAVMTPETADLIAKLTGAPRERSAEELRQDVRDLRDRAT